MTKESRRKWILGTIGAVIVGTPVVLLNGWTLDAVQQDIRKTVEAGKPDTGLASRQTMVASVYRYTFRGESAAEAYRQYMKLFYKKDRDGDDSEGKKRAQDAIWDYASVLDENDHRPQACYYYSVLLRDWEEHAQKNSADNREHVLEKDGNGGWSPPEGEEQ